MAVALLAGASLYYDAAFLLDWHNASADFQRSGTGTCRPRVADASARLFQHIAALCCFGRVCAADRRLRALRDLALLPISATIYIVALATGINLPSWPEGGTWFLNPLAWQFIYVLGFLLGGKDGIGWLARRYRKVFFLIGLPIVGFGLVVALTHYSPRPDDVPSPKLFFVFDKTFQSPARLIDMLGLAAVFAGSFPFLMRWFASGVRLCSMLGRHSLYIFCAASLLSLAGQIFRFAYGGAVLTDAMIAGAGLAIMGIVAWLSEQQDGSRRSVADGRASPKS